MMHVSIAARPAARPVSADAPRILMIATMPWMFPARLAKALRKVGFEVESVCQVGHALRCLETPIPAHRLGWLREAASIEKAIERFEPDLLVPCDDPAVANLHALYRRGCKSSLAALIERSLGSPEGFAVTAKRTSLVAYARHLGLRVPRSERVGDPGTLTEAGRRIGYPCVLKRDRSWSGIGVTPVESEADLGRAWSAGGSVGLLQAAKAMVRERRPRALLDALADATPEVELQEYVAGVPANRAVVCREGRVLAGVSVVALRTAHPRGPASLVRVVDHAQMASTVEAIVASLGLSGFCGFDFIVTPSGESYLLELNPRATPICHIALANGVHLPAAVFREMTGMQPLDAPDAICRDLIALFPNEWQRDRSSPSLRYAHHDVPFDEPTLLKRAGYTAHASAPASVAGAAAPHVAS